MFDLSFCAQNVLWQEQPLLLQFPISIDLFDDSQSYIFSWFMQSNLQSLISFYCKYFYQIELIHTIAAALLAYSQSQCSSFDIQKSNFPLALSTQEIANIYCLLMLPFYQKHLFIFQLLE